MRQRGKRLMKTLKKSVYAQAAKAYDEGETIPPYMVAPPAWYDNEPKVLKIEARGAGKTEYLNKLKEAHERKKDGMD